ncbi:hypothetical protein [Phenylobacterium sp.]|uniref:hypothetical protein n=1 Tax=Phenylobacterium sp. TaxID=1871053 RepID=UPI0035B3798F
MSQDLEYDQRRTAQQADAAAMRLARRNVVERARQQVFPKAPRAANDEESNPA